MLLHHENWSIRTLDSPGTQVEVKEVTDPEDFDEAGTGEEVR